MIITSSGYTHKTWLAERPFTLSLSAGFFGFFAHTGFLKALEEANIRPRRITGASAGALAGGLWASGVQAEQIRERLCMLTRREFWDPGLPLGGFLKGKKFSALLADLLPKQASFSDMRIPFEAMAYDVMRRCTIVLKDGGVESAIRASCAVPGMFRPVSRQGRLLVDGGVKDRSALSSVEQQERVLLHYLPSTSIWSRGHSQEKSAAPSRKNGKTVVLLNLPRVSPFRLSFGAAAYAQAYEAMRSWLAAPVCGGDVVEVDSRSGQIIDPTPALVGRIR